VSAGAGKSVSSRRLAAEKEGKRLRVEVYARPSWAQQCSARTCQPAKIACKSARHATVGGRYNG